MVEETKFCTDIMKKYFNKELMMTKEMMKISKTLVNVGFVIMFMFKVILMQEIIVILLENTEALHIETVTSTLNHKTSIVFYNLKNYDYVLIMSPMRFRVDSQPLSS